jgi:hypothetical protein
VQRIATPVKQLGDAGVVHVVADVLQPVDLDEQFLKGVRQGIKIWRNLSPACRTSSRGTPF